MQSLVTPVVPGLTCTWAAGRTSKWERYSWIGSGSPVVASRWTVAGFIGLAEHWRAANSAATSTTCPRQDALAIVPLAVALHAMGREQ